MTDRDLLREARDLLASCINTRMTEESYREAMGGKDSPRFMKIMERIDARLSEPADVVTVPRDKGPWTVSDDGFRVQSDDFTHDVTLEIIGDFADNAQRKKYAEWVADVLTCSAVYALAIASIDAAQKKG